MRFLNNLDVAILFVVTLPTFGAASATNVYIAQSAAGSANGSGCANAYAVTFFNSSANWGPSATQIGAGTTVHLCGTVTSELSFNGSGTSGSMIELLFETGASIQISPGADSNGAVNLGSNNYLVIDGGANTPCGWNTATDKRTGYCNGQIENMLYGSNDAICPGGACTTQANSGGNLIQGRGNNVEIRNLRVGPSYIHTASGNGISGTVNTSGNSVTYVSGTNFSICGGSTSSCPYVVLNGIYYGVSAVSNGSITTTQSAGSQTAVTYQIGNDTAGTGCISDNGGSTWNIHDNQLDDGNWCVTVGWGNVNNITIANNYFVNNSHHVAMAGYGAATLNGFTFSGNFTSDMCSSASHCWDSAPADAWHGDAIHIYGTPGQSIAEHMTINNNIFGGETGADVTAQLFSEEFSSMNNVAIFNNLFIQTSHWGTSSSNYSWGPAECDSSCYFVSNTIARGNNSGTNWGLGYSTYSFIVTLENNVNEGSATLASIGASSPSLTLNYNAYGPNGGRPFNPGGASFATWQSSSREGSASIYNSSSLGLSASYQPALGSPLIGAGVNVCATISAFCATYPSINNDLAGNPRPSNGAWDIGAYQHQFAPAPPTGLSAAAQ